MNKFSFYDIIGATINKDLSDAFLGRGIMGSLFVIFLSMLKIGCFAFGGGYAIIALLENEFISKRTWLDRDEFLDVVTMVLTVFFGVESVKNINFSFDWRTLAVLSAVIVVPLVWKRFKKKEFSSILLVLISGVLGMVFFGF